MRRLNSVRIGNVLQVGVAAREPPGGGHGLVEIGVDAARLRLHQGRQGIHVGALELAEGAVLQHQRHHGMGIFELVEHGGIGAPPGLGLAGLPAIEPEGVEQQFAQLFGAGQVEVHPCGLPSPRSPAAAGWRPVQH